MDRTINQVKKDFEEIATQHRQINSFFWGDFVDAINRDAVDYPLMVCTLQPGSSGDHFVNVVLNLTLADKYNEDDYRNIDEVHSDMYRIFRDIWATLKQYKFEEYLEIDGNSSDEPFINEGADMCAGWSHTLTLKIFDEENHCAIPYDSYDFEN